MAKESAGAGKGSYLDPYVKARLANMHAELGNIYKDLGLYKEAADEYRSGLNMRPEFEDKDSLRRGVQGHEGLQ